MRVIKSLLLLLVVMILVLSGILFFSVRESRFSCERDVIQNDQSSSIFLILEEYRPWVGLWSDSEGTLWVEIPRETVEYFGYLERAGEHLQVYNSRYSDGVEEKVMVGHFSLLSKTVSLKLNGNFFDGHCTSIE